MSKKGFFAARKPEQGIAATSTVTIEERFDLEDFERQVVEEARANNEIRHIAKDLIDPDPNQPRSETRE